MFVGKWAESRNRLALFLALAALSIGLGALRWYASHLDRRVMDEDIGQAVVLKVLKTGSVDTNWARADVPSWFRYNEYNFSAYYLAVSAFEKLLGHAADDVRRPQEIVVHAREFSAILGGLCIFFGGVLGWRFGGAIPALCVALLTGCSALLFQDSLRARPETFVTLLTLLWMIVLTAGARRGIVAMSASGLLGGILVATKFTFVVYLPIPLMMAGWWLANEGKEPEESQQLRWVAGIGIYLFLVGVGFFVSAPYAVKDPAEYLQGVSALLSQYQNVLGSANDLPALMGRVESNSAYLLYIVGYVTLMLSVAGIFWLVAQRQLKYGLIVAAPLFLIVYFLRAAPYFERNFSQSLPALFLLAGLGAKWLADRARPRPLLRSGVAATLVAAAVLAPGLVTAKIIDPALDGRFWRELDAQSKTLAEGGRTAVLNLGRGDSTQFCGPFVVMVWNTSNQREIEALLGHGYRLAAKVETPFVDDPPNSLETNFAPTALFLAPVKASIGSCPLGLGPLIDQPGLSPVRGRIQMTGGWAVGAASASVPSGRWRWPLYGSGGAANSGSLEIGPFQACGDLIVPYTIGRGDKAVSIKVTEYSGSHRETLFSGIPPSAPYQWQALRIHQPPDSCKSFSVSADDEGTGWEQWLGVGLPVTLSSSPLGNSPSGRH